MTIDGMKKQMFSQVEQHLKAIDSKDKVSTTTGRTLKITNRSKYILFS